jgi:hypothetical protein
VGIVLEPVSYRRAPSGDDSASIRKPPAALSAAASPSPRRCEPRWHRRAAADQVAAFSASMTVGALMLPEEMLGMLEELRDKFEQMSSLAGVKKCIVQALLQIKVTSATTAATCSVRRAGQAKVRWMFVPSQSAEVNVTRSSFLSMEHAAVLRSFMLPKDEEMAMSRITTPGFTGEQAIYVSKARYWTSPRHVTMTVDIRPQRSKRCDEIEKYILEALNAQVMAAVGGNLKAYYAALTKVNFGLSFFEEEQC